MNVIKTIFGSKNVDNIIVEEDLDPQNTLCRICLYFENDTLKKNDLISPCGCKGSVKYVHKSCLQVWRYRGKRLKIIKMCEQCKMDYKIGEEYTPRGFMIHFITIFTIAFILCVTNFVVSTIVEAYVISTNSNSDENNGLLVKLLSGDLKNTDIGDLYLIEENLPLFAISFYRISIIVGLIYHFVTLSYFGTFCGLLFFIYRNFTSQNNINNIGLMIFNGITYFYFHKYLHSMVENKFLMFLNCLHSNFE